MYRGVWFLALLSLVCSAWSRIQYLGVAISGIDFGCDIDGTCPTQPESIPLAEFGGGDGAGQMKHFVEDDNMNVFRLPLTWQFITKGQAGGQLDHDNFAAYDKVMQACLDTGAYCMIDLHNFARYDGEIIGQGGPTDDQFSDLWSQIASKYAKEDKVIFGIMNEPHDLDTTLWANSCQAAVNTIRKAGAKDQMILLPGTNFTNAGTFVSTGSADLLDAIKNPDGTKDGLVMDLHKYLDINNSGDHPDCTTNNVEDFTTIATWLRKVKRKGMISETGASMLPSCMTDFCEQNKFIAENTDVFIGFVGWGAGSFKSDYILSLTPSGKAGSYTDNKLMKQCILEPFNKGSVKTTTSKTSTTSKPTTTTSKTTSTSTHESETTTAAASDKPQPPSESDKDDDSAASRSVALAFQAAGVAAILVFFTHV